VKNCDLDLSVEWFQLLFRKIKLKRIINEGNIDMNTQHLVFHKICTNIQQMSLGMRREIK